MLSDILQMFQYNENSLKLATISVFPMQYNGFFLESGKNLNFRLQCNVFFSKSSKTLYVQRQATRKDHGQNY